MSTENMFEDERFVTDVLKREGVFVESSQDLLVVRDLPKNVAKALVEILPMLKTAVVTEIVVRILGDRRARGIAERALIEVFDSYLEDASQEASNLKWAVGNSLDLIGGNAVADDIHRLLRDARSGAARQTLCLAAGQTKDRQFVPTLVDLLKEGEVVGHAAIALGKLEAVEATRDLSQVASTTKNQWWKKMALKAIQRIERSNTKLK